MASPESKLSPQEAEALSPEDRMRREVLRWLTRGAVAAYAVGVSLPVAGFLGAPFRDRTEKLPERFTVANANRFGAGSWKLVKYGSIPALVLRTPQGELRSWSAVCPHLGCTVGYDGARNEIFCGCHGARFSAQTGECLAGPARQPLRALRVVEEDGKIVLRPGSNQT